MVDEVSYLIGTSEEEWELFKYDESSDNCHAINDWMREAGLIIGADVLKEQLLKKAKTYKGPVLTERWQEWIDDHKRLKSLIPDRAIAANSAHICVSLYDPAWMQLLFEDPELVGVELDRQADEACMLIPLMAEAGADVIMGGGDCAMNTGPAYQPELFRTLLAPRIKRIATCCEENGLPFVFVTDGNTWRIAEFLFGKEHGGAHGYCEIDYNAGMRLDEIRNKFPGLTLVGNVDSTYNLAMGTEAKVREHCKEVLEAGGGYRHIYGISNTVMPETPVGNFLAMHEVHAEFKLPQPVLEEVPAV